MKILKEEEINDNSIWVNIRMNLAKTEPLLIVEYPCSNCQGYGCYSCHMGGKVSRSFSSDEMKDLKKSLSSEAMKSIRCKLKEFVDLIRTDEV